MQFVIIPTVSVQKTVEQTPTPKEILDKATINHLKENKEDVRFLASNFVDSVYVLTLYASAEVSIDQEEKDIRKHIAT